MNLKGILLIAICLISSASFAQGTKGNGNGGSKPNPRGQDVRNYHERPSPFWIKSGPTQMFINDLHCSIEFWSKDRIPLIVLNCGFHPCLLLDGQSEIRFLLQDGTTINTFSNGSQAGGQENPPPCRDCGTPAWPYQYSYTFLMDTNNLKAFAKTGIKSAQLIENPQQQFNMLLVSKDEADSVKQRASNLLAAYNRHFHNKQ